MSTMNGFCSHHVETKLDRVVNFAAGPCCLPVEILLEAQQDLLCYKQARMSVMEMSHRSKEFLSIFNETKHTLEEILGVPTNYKLIFMQGGATQQFSAVPLNLLGTQRAKASYVITGLGRGLFLLFSCWVALSAIPSFGVYPSILFFLNVGLRCVLCSSWSEKAFIEGLKYATATKAVDTLPSNYTEIPSETEWMVDADARYLHYCSNETIYGVEFKHTPNVSVPLGRYLQCIGPDLLCNPLRFRCRCDGTLSFLSAHVMRLHRIVFQLDGDCPWLYYITTEPMCFQCAICLPTSAQSLWT
eukprot:GHVQ01002439.1.p1 GENE.GHVQ01002439.1~~GHVQ01002439.1.p1  ORF type:complete len:301 (-),score=29.12 GHVQ01002439.1:1022-1924(-)